MIGRALEDQHGMRLTPTQPEISQGVSQCSLKTSAAITSTFVGAFPNPYEGTADDMPSSTQDPCMTKSEESMASSPPEYTSEHLEKALFDLRSTVNSNDLMDLREETVDVSAEPKAKEIAAREQLIEAKVEMEVKETMVVVPESCESEMSTEITYPANIEHLDKINEIKPTVENMSTQSTNKLNIHTATEVTPIKSKGLGSLSNELPTSSTSSNTKVIATNSDRQIRKSKVPVLKSDRANKAVSSTNILTSSTQIRARQSTGSKIPQRTATSLSPNRESVSNSKSNLSVKWPALQRTKNARISIERKDLQNATSAPSVKIISNRNIHPCRSSSKNQNVSIERVSSSRFKQLPNSSKQRKDIPLIITPPVGYKFGREAQLQTDQIPPCGSNHTMKKEHEPEQCKEKRRTEIEQICQNLIDNILNVEQALDNLPRADVVTLSALCAAYNNVIGQHNDALAKDAGPEVQANINSNIKSEEEISQQEPKTYEIVEADNKPEVQNQKYEEPKDTSKEESTVESTTPEIIPDPIPEKIHSEVTIAEKRDCTRPTESVDTIQEVESDEDYEEDDESMEVKDVVGDLNKIEDKSRQSFGGKSLARESKTCLLGSSASVTSCNSETLQPKAVPKHTDIIRASAESSAISEPSVALPTAVSMSDVIKSVSSRTFMVITKPKLDPKKKIEDNLVRKGSSTINVKQKSTHNLNGFKRSREDLAIEANLFNMIQSQKINNILRFAMPHNETLLPVFVSSPSSIMHTLKLEMMHTLETKRMYYCAIAHTPETGAAPPTESASVSSGVRVKSEPSADKSQHSLRGKLERSKSMCLMYGSVIGLRGVTPSKTAWTKPLFYYGETKPPTTTCAR